MTNRARRHPDPKGYYRVLGVPPDAGADAIKAAWRRRAKDLHPDAGNASAEGFQSLGEAYRVLSDPRQRAAYDRGGATTTAAPTTPPPPPPPPHASHLPRTCACCGKTTAQPRHVVFPTVRGRLTRSEIGAVVGVLCRRCADRTGARAAWGTWLRGWWSLPWGPWHTVRALWVILGGGQFPKAENHALLLHQSRAFLLRGDEDLARGLALQALSFATTEEERRHARNLIAAVPAEGRRALRNRWLRPTFGRLMPAAPVVLAVAAMAVAVDLHTPAPPLPALPPPQERLPSVSGIPGLSTPFLLRNGHLYEVLLPGLPLRDGPGPIFPVLAELEAGTVVMVSDNTLGGGWVRVFVGSDAAGSDLGGYVSARYLRPSLPQRGLDGSFAGTEASADDQPSLRR